MVPVTDALRPGSREDAAMLIAMHARCSAETIRRRYHTPMPHLSPRLARELLTPQRGQSMVMTSADTLVGIASLARDPDGEYEVGLLVEDRWQRQGIGSRLLRTLAHRAAGQDVTRLTCHVQPDNQALVATIRRAGFVPRIQMVDGLLQARIPLTPLHRPARTRTNKTPISHVTPRLVPLLHARAELREVSPVADIIDHAVREGA
jgi:RimJ/RimL family protein N-acetyltransferase